MIKTKEAFSKNYITSHDFMMTSSEQLRTEKY